MNVVSDTTPLIGLASIQRLDLLSSSQDVIEAVLRQANE